MKIDTHPKRLIAVLALASVFLSCVGRPGADDLRVASSPTGSGDADTDQDPGGATKTPRSDLQQLVDTTKKDLAEFLGVDQSLIETLSAEHVTWRDSSLGCPEAGYEYMQVLTPGTLIRLRWNGQVYEYHRGGNHPPFLCRTPDPQGALPSDPGEA